MVILESSILCDTAPPLTSCIPLSQCKLQAVCSGGQLHAIAFGEIAILSFERASNCTNILYFEEVSKYFCEKRPFLGLVKSHGVSSVLSSQSTGFTAVRNTDCLPLLRLLPPGINPFLIIEYISLTFPTW